MRPARVLPPYSGLALGSHTLLVRQTDTDGNTGVPATVNWQVVAPPLAPVVTSQPVTSTGSGMFTFAFAAGDTTAAGFECSIDGGPFATCASGTDVDPGLADGVHTFAARAVTGTGPESGPSTTPISWRIARQPPAAPAVSS